MTEEANKNICCIKRIYRETSNTASCVETILFYVSIIFTAFFSYVVWNGFEYKYLVFLFPVPYWIFLRASRKDMRATGNLIAGGLGAIGGALVVILTKLIK